jgi:hypothetical protein
VKLRLDQKRAGRRPWRTLDVGIGREKALVIAIPSFALAAASSIMGVSLW